MMKLYVTPGTPYARMARNPGFRWRARHPKLSTWFDRVAARPSFAATAPRGAA